MSQGPQQFPRRSYTIKIVTLLVDVAILTIALCGAYFIRFDFQIWPEYQDQLYRLLPIVVSVRITSLYYLGGYHSLWKYTSLSDLGRLVRAVVAGSVMLVIINYFRNYPVAIAIGTVSLGSTVAYAGIQRLLPQKRRLLIAISVLMIGTLACGFLAVALSGPVVTSLDETTFLDVLVARDFKDSLAMPRAVVVLEGILAFMLISGARVAPRLVRELHTRRRRRGRRVLVYGAGDVGEHLVRAMVNHPEFGLQPVGFIDDHPSKKGVRIHGIEVVDNRLALPKVFNELRVDELLIAIADLPVDILHSLARSCRDAEVAVRRVPGLSSLLEPQAGLQQLEEVDLEHLLGRTEVELDPDRVVGYLQERVVLVTGAGGSIGSELCRQICRCRPSQLLLLGKGENSIYEIQKELAGLFPEQSVVSLIGDVANSGKMDFLFRTYRPHVVFHAAAHKHVPFMEDCPEEAIRNNILGTRIVAEAALLYQSGLFVLISSDKAVHPSSVMGTTKKVAELIVQQLADQGDVQFLTVRFGNVLRSRGSVVPLFERQIRDGGPVTVTHPEMTRYFMSIPEAVRLVLHSGAVGTSGDLCILEMGEPVKIAALAENMIRMAGKRPHEEIEIVYTGIRPGEKLSEDLYTNEEARALRKVDRILICRPETCDFTDLDGLLGRLSRLADECRREEIRTVLEEMVPAFETGSLPGHHV
jgi:FlaA1/EpsC-like NDP-sugar epimerase